MKILEIRKNSVKKDKKKKSDEDYTEERSIYYTEGFYVDENGDEQYTEFYYTED